MKIFLVLAVLISTTMLTTKASEVSPKALVGIESTISTMKSELKSMYNIEAVSQMDGKILATQLILIEDKIIAAEDKLDAIESDADLTQPNIDAIKAELKSAQELMDEV